jgi:tRNA threonylcarbamoyl adenosine modification protein (Sua5/YciO/YrdC/YwlC family)
MEDLIATAVDLLRRGRVVGMPTDTVYGLAADPTSREGVARLYEIKGRPADKPIALLVASVEQAETLVEVSGWAADLGRRHWPGPLTLVLPMSRPLPRWVGDPEKRTVGVRVPDHPMARELLEAAGPLAVTSANPSGEPPALDHHTARRMFGNLVDLYIEGTCPGGTASTVVDATGDRPRILRRGPVDISDS